ncbi:VCBS domain-containing protein [Qipengyuania gaetbuli]|uniref:DUF5801 repeats-in-toxin domain-containing protein n=1 Tax=Qipengyuania gaetbuli TaxID=266952 RepID=UPI001C99820A|nr:DUF5801 repeats-in-toxin domain-containing protein [Qipengyuania gaetbuli]MBY6015526.1 VCBS domain-containing protein [Qipengyuania gaetbuli]
MDSFEQNGEFTGAQESQDTGDNPRVERAPAQRSARGDIVITPDENGVVVLPDGASLENLTASGRDLVLVLDDGTRIIIPEGAIIVPQIVVDGVTIPAANLAALLTGNEPQPAAGDPQSSGGNFEVDPGAIQAAYDLGDLLPYTELQFPQPEEREIIPNAPDQDPDIIIETPDNPAGVINAIATVAESGLPERTVDGVDESEGTQSETNGETANGTIVFNAPDGVGSVAINGVAITAVGQTFVGEYGVLTITSIDFAGGQIGFSFTLNDNLVGETVDGSYSMTVTDIDGDTATATLQIIVIDDAPIAQDDTGSVPGGSHETISGSVLVNDESGADNYAPSGAVNGFANAGGSAAPGATLAGTYGELTLNADGTYEYTRFVNTPGGVSEQFTYTIVDADGSTSTATLTINIGDAPNVITNVPEGDDATVVDEGQLPPNTGTRTDEPEGSDFDGDDETATGTITFNSPDGVGSVSIGGTVITPGSLPQVVFSDETGTLAVTGYTYDPVTGAGTITYVYELTDNTGDADTTTVTFPIVITDLDGDTASDDLEITIVDDTPTALDDSATQGRENAPVSVNVIANDTPGADGVDLSTGVAAVDGTLSGGGSLAYIGDGTFTYTPAAGETGTVTFDYAITDGDGDVSTATVTITLSDDSTPQISVEGDDDVEEAALAARDGEPAGSNEASTGETASGVIAISTGNDTVASLVVNGVNVTGGGTVTTAAGVLTISVNNGAYSYSYELKDNTLSDPDSESFTLTVTDSDGDTASTTLVIAIIDDAPTANDDANAFGAGTYGPVGGNVLSNDVQGADSADVTSYSSASDSGVAGENIQGLYGTLTIAADGTYSYTRDAGTPGGVEDSFDYVITDDDGDTSTATLVISIADSPVTLDLPVAGGATTQVDEAGLAAGSDAASNSEFTSGTFTFTAPDGPAVLTIDGAPLVAGQTYTGSFGTLTITSVGNGTVGYTYELTTNTNGDTTSDSFAIVVTDQDGDSISGDLEIAIVDDVPTARPDTDSVTEDGPLLASGNVITDAEANGDNGGDTRGADGATVTDVDFGATDGTPGTPLQGLYGTLTLNADGSYSYELDNTNETVQGLDETESLTEVFTYTLTDGDTDESVTTLTITINGADDPVVINDLSLTAPEGLVDEDDLADGSDTTKESLVTNGTFSVDAQDGLETLTIGGTAVFGAGVTYPVVLTGDYGTLRITGVTPVTDADGDTVSLTVSWEYELSQNTLDHTVIDSQDSLFDAFDVVATDSDGSSASSVLDIEVVDDVPTANDDGVVQAAENQAFTIDALDNDVFGADGVDTADVASVEVTTQASQGTVTYDPATGLFTYTPAPGAGSNGNLTDSFTYTITDNDGDTSTATVEVTLKPDSEPQGGERTASVDDDGLAGGNAASTTGDLDANDGDDPADTSEASFTGTLFFDVGNDTPAAIAFDPALEGASASLGTETVTYSISGNTLTASSARGAVFTVEITDSATGEYTVTLLQNVLHAAGSDENDASVSIDFTVTDSDGDQTTTNLGIVFDDDAPSAYDNANDVSEGGSTAGNVLTDSDGFGLDAAGADGYAAGGGIVSISSVNETITQTTVDVDGNLVIVTTLGTLTLNATTGAYTYESKVDSTNADVADVFTYTIRDGDGDEATATLTIDIDNVAGQVFDNDAIVDEKGLPTGSGELANGDSGDNSDPSEVDANGQITVTGATGTLVYTLLDPATGSYGTLTLDSDTGEYTYTLTSAVDGDTLVPDHGGNNSTNTVTGFETFDYEVRDTLGNLIGTGTISVSIVDDVPTARDETLQSVKEDAVGTIGGDVMANDTEGADGATVTSITVGLQTVAVPQDGTDATVITANGTYTIDMDGNWTFDPNTGLDQSGGDIVADFSYTLTDGDGDISTATQPIRIEDGTGPADPTPGSVTVDDQNLADGSTPAGDDFDSFTLNFTEGSDAFASFVFGDTSGLLGGLTWLRVDDNTITGSDGGRLVITLELSVSGNDATVTATLEDNYLGHTNPLLDEIATLGSIDVIATDIDGDFVTGSVLVRVSDDRPTLEAAAPAADSIEVDETDLGVPADADFSGLFTPDYNADGPGSVGGYVLGLTGSATSLVDTATGEAVEVSMNGTTIEGRTATSADLVFTITVASDGTVTLTQLRAVVHADDTDPDDATGGLADDLVTLTATVTDGDGDTANATANIGGAFSFRDDGPSIDAAVVDNDTVLLTTFDVDTIGGEGADSSSADFGDAFSVASSDFGADGAGSVDWSYDLLVSGNSSGLTSDGVPVVIAMNGTVVEGRANGLLVFTIEVAEDTGIVTLTQYEEIDHDLPGSSSNYDAQFEILGTGLVTLRGTATIEDRDGDKASETVTLDLGGNIRFADHGPDVTVTGAIPTLITDESTLPDGANATFADVFGFDFGADGAGAVNGGKAYTLGISATGVDSGLDDSLTGNNVYLFLEGGVVVGREGTDSLDAATGEQVFTLSVDANGFVNLTQLRSVEHSDPNNNNEAAFLASDDLITLTATATDGDGDTDSATIEIGRDIELRDDNPAAGSRTVQLDDDTETGGNPGGTGDVTPDTSNTTGTLPHSFGNDGGTIAFLTNGAPAGFQYVASGNDILIQQDQGGSWVTVVTVTLVPTTGAYTVTQNANVLHAAGGDENDLSLSLTYRVTDGDLDTDDGTLTINIDDDTPIARNDTDSMSEDDDSAFGDVILGTGTTDGASGSDLPGADGVGDPAILSITHPGLGNSDSTADGSGDYSVVGTYGTLVMNEDGSYEYILDKAAVQILDDTESVTDTFTYTMQDGDGDTSTATLTITVNGANDAPVANADTNWIVEDGGPITGNVIVGETHNGAPDSIDRADVADSDVDIEQLFVAAADTGTINGTYGVLTLNADGSYSYRLYTQGENAGAYNTVQALDVGDTPLTDTFVYNAFDGTAQSNETSLTISIFGANDAPVIGTATVAVSDEGFTNGIKDSVGNPTDTTNSLVAVGAVTISDVDGDALMVTLSIPDETLAVADGSALGSPITWSLTNGGKTLVGTYDDPNNPGTDIPAITVTIDDAGGFNVVQSAPIFHSDTTSEDVTQFQIDVNVNDGTVTETKTDAITVKIEDDSPVATVAAALSMTNTAGTIHMASLDTDDGNVDNNYGGDGGRVIFTAATIASLESQNLTSGLAQLSYSISADGTVLTAVKAGTTTEVFTITLDPDSADDMYVLDLSLPLDATSNIDFNGGGYNFVGGNGSWAGFNQPGTTGSLDVLLTPTQGNNVDSSTVNTNANEGGIGSGNSVGTGEAMRVDFVIDLAGSPKNGADYSILANQNHSFAGHYDVNGASALFTQISGGTAKSTVELRAYRDTDTDNDVGDGTAVNINGVVIEYNGVTKIITTAGNHDVGGNTFNVTFNGDFATVAGVVSNTRLGGIADTNYNSIEFHWAGGQTFKIGDFNTIAITDDPVPFTVPISIKDNDGDTVSSGVLDITLNAAVTPVVLDLDGGGNSFVSKAAGVAYDYNGDSVKAQTAWIAAGSAILAYDMNGDGAVSGASEFVFGTSTMTDLEAIAAKYDSDGNGKLDASDDAYGKFGVWIDGDLDGVSDDGEFVSLSDMGIVSIDLVSDGIQSVAADGDVTVFGKSAFTWADGTTGEVSDTAFATGGAVDNSMEALLQMTADLPGTKAPAADFLGDAALASTLGDAISDVVAEAGVDALVAQFDVRPTGEGGGNHSHFAAEGLLDAMVHPGLAQSLASGMTVDNLDEAAAQAGAAA